MANLTFFGRLEQPVERVNGTREWRLRLLFANELPWVSLFTSSFLLSHGILQGLSLSAVL